MVLKYLFLHLEGIPIFTVRGNSKFYNSSYWRRSCLMFSYSDAPTVQVRAGGSFRQVSDHRWLYGIWCAVCLLAVVTWLRIICFLHFWHTSPFSWCIIITANESKSIQTISIMLMGIYSMCGSTTRMNSILGVLIVDVPISRPGYSTCNWLVCILHCGHNVMILWGLVIEPIILFQNIYAKPIFLCIPPDLIL